MTTQWSGDEARTDRPRTNQSADERQRKTGLLFEPRVKPLSDFVLGLRAEHPNVPWFDPTEAATNARILLLLEAPGGRATAAKGSGFISPDNDDLTAKNMWLLLRDAGIDRRRMVVTWNVVPWYIGTERAVRATQLADIRAAHEALERLIGLLPNVRVIVLLGLAARKAWSLAGVDDLPTVETWHPSPRGLAKWPGRRDEIRQSLVRARELAGYT